MATRIKSAVVAIIIAVILLVLHDTFIFNIGIGFISVMALWELFRATDMQKHKYQSIACYVFAGLDAVMPAFLSRGHLTFITYKCYAGLFVMAMCLLFLREHKTFKYNDLFFMLGAGILLPYALGTLTAMARINTPHAEHLGAFLVLITLCGAWLSDSGAYFAGTFLGKHKLCPEISPKKTVEGVIGGVVSNGVLMLLISLIYAVINRNVSMNYAGIFIAGMLCSLVGLLGDLTASVIKRQTGIKDYGNIMPGHGGVLDRFDSVILVAPFMFYLISQGLIVKELPLF